MNTAAIVILAYVGAACGGVVALIAACRSWRSISVWFFVAGMALLAVESAFSGLAIDAALKEDALRWQFWRLMTLSLLPGVWLLFSLSYARGNSRQFFRQWAYALIVAFAVPTGLVALSKSDWLITHSGNGMEETDLQWVFQLQAGGFVLYALFLMSIVLVMMNLERTFRTAVGTMRWRIKFMILGLAILFAIRIYTASQGLLWQKLDPTALALNSGALVLASLLILRSLFRDISEVSVFPPRAVWQNSLTFLVAGIYLISTAVLFKLAVLIQSFEAKALLLLVVLVAVTVIALSDRARMQTRRFISHYFQRPFYDYRTVWRTLTEGIASRVKQPDLCQAAVTLISDIFQVLSVTMWLVDDKRENLVFAASTSLSPTAGEALKPQKEHSKAIMEELQEHRQPSEFEAAKGEWAAALRRLTPVQFPEYSGNLVCVPLTGGGPLVGVITLADRVGGVYFSLQDFDLLRCVGDQVAAGLRNVQLSQKLLEAKELEAFQTMSAFFVHDLKNTASTLNLMLQNLPIHFDNPDFRQDALRGMAKTCEHINDLISRLSQLRHGLQMKPVESDLNEVVTDVLSTWKGIAGMTLTRNLRPCPKVLLDQDQIGKVVTNLVINASEAISTSGEIRVETSQNNGWAVLEVADNGCGMSPEFLSKALFRPFQTTKKKGLGIGMFHSKMIVEAHGGRIEVESEAQKGTSFRILLPISPQKK